MVGMCSRAAQGSIASATSLMKVVDDGLHVILLGGALEGAYRVGGGGMIVVDDDLDLAPVDAAMGVDVVGGELRALADRLPDDRGFLAITPILIGPGPAARAGAVPPPPSPRAKANVAPAPARTIHRCRIFRFSLFHGRPGFMTAWAFCR